MVKFCASGAVLDSLKAGEEYWDRAKTLKELKEVGGRVCACMCLYVGRVYLQM